MPQIPLLVAAALVEVGIPIGVSIAATNAVIAVAATVGANLAVTALSRTSTPGLGGINSAAGVNAPEARGSVKQDIPPHRIWIGEMRAGGVVFFYEVKPPYLYIGLIHSLLPLSEITGAFVAENELVFNSYPDNQIIAPLPMDGQPAYNERISVCFQYGGLSQPTNALIASDFPELVPGFRLPGIPNSVWRFHYGANFDEFQSLYGNVAIPDAKIVAKGCPLPDPRVASHRLSFDPRDMSDLYDAIGTWDYSANSTLVSAFWAAMPFGLNAGPAAVYASRHVELLKRSADFDDEAVPLLAGGAQKRHSAEGVVTLDQAPLAVAEAITNTNGGFISPRAGSVVVSSSQPRDPVATIRDADIIAWASFANARAKRDLVNTATVRFVAPEANFEEAETSWPSQDAIDDMVAEDGEILEQTLTLNMVKTAPRAQRRLKQYVQQSRLNKSLALTVGRRLFGLAEGDVVNVQLTQYPSASGLYSVEEWAIGDDFSGLSLTLAEYDPGIARDWTASTDEQPFEVASLDVAA